MEQSSSLEIGIIFVDFHSADSTPWCKKDWKFFVRIGAISYDSSLRKYAGIPSGPVALWGFRSCKRLATASTETDYIHIFIGKENHSVLVTIDDRSSWVKIDVK